MQIYKKPFFEQIKKKKKNPTLFKNKNVNVETLETRW